MSYAQVCAASGIEDSTNLLIDWMANHGTREAQRAEWSRCKHTALLFVSLLTSLGDYLYFNLV